MFGRRTNSNPFERMIEDIMVSFPETVYRTDALSRDTIITTRLSPEVGDHITFDVALPYSFPMTPPQVRLRNASRKYLAGLEAMSRSGILNEANGQILFEQVFAWSPEIKGSTLIYLTTILVRTACRLADSRVGTTERSMPAAVHDMRGT